MTTTQGLPCWYELSTSQLEPATEFYGSVLGWTFQDAGVEGMPYTLASAADDGMVAGVTDLAAQPEGTPPNWLIYFGCDDCDATAAAVGQAGGATFMEPTDIPDTGRIAVCADPQGAVFGILQPEPMGDETQAPAPFDQEAVGHGGWHELMTTDPVAAFDFYAALFGWTKGEGLDMGEMGTYQLFQHDGGEIGGIMALGDAPVPAWLPYFGVSSIDAGVDRLRAGGGTLHHGPAEVPGGGFIAVAQDPQGAWFALLGPGSS